MAAEEPSTSVVEEPFPAPECVLKLGPDQPPSDDEIAHLRDCLDLMAADDLESVVPIVVAEVVRCIVAQTAYMVDGRPKDAVPTHYGPSTRSSARMCRFGARCRRPDAAWHWVETSHPPEHPWTGLPTPPARVFRLTGLRVCRHWREKGSCAMGDLCRFSHEAHACGTDPVSENHRLRPEKKRWRNRGRRNENRGAVFRRWLIDAFGLEQLKEGAGVLDVAGGGAGGGGLAFQMLNYSGIPATIVDPRAPDNRKARSKLAYTSANSTTTVHAAYDVDVTPIDEVARLPPFVLRRFEDTVAVTPLGAPPEADKAGLPPDRSWARPRSGAKNSTTVNGSNGRDKEGDVDAAVGAEEKDGLVASSGGAATADRSTTSVVDVEGTERGEGEGEEGGDDDTQSMELVDDNAIRPIVEQCSVVCGLHPDQATEPLVDWALQAGKPFAVVPCCVFWRNNERLRDHGVRTYDQYVDYLASKRPPGEIRRGQLMFDGRNTVLWWPGARC